MGVSRLCISTCKVFGDTWCAERLQTASPNFFLMKKLVVSLFVLLCTTMSFAQTSLLATLSHEGSISTYYGSSALKEALEKATDGDAITLSAGQFLAANITKNVTLRGAGMSVRTDSIYSHEATIVQGAFEIVPTDSTTGRIIVEGVYFTSDITYKGLVRNPLFMKSRFSTVKSGDGGRLVNATLIHCRVASGFGLADNSNACFVNSVVWEPTNDGTNGSNFEFDNCVISFPGENSINTTTFAGKVINSYYKNCMIMAKWQRIGPASYPFCGIPYSCTAINCVGCCSTESTNEHDNNIFCNISSKNTTNKNVIKPAAVLETGGFTYNDSEKYELIDEAKTKYLGTDGKQIGIYGGSLPYEEDPTTPQITKCNVAAKSTADGKLSVDIEVKAAEY